MTDRHGGEQLPAAVVLESGAIAPTYDETTAAKDKPMPRHERILVAIDISDESRRWWKIFQ